MLLPASGDLLDVFCIKLGDVDELFMSVAGGFHGYQKCSFLIKNSSLNKTIQNTGLKILKKVS